MRWLMRWIPALMRTLLRGVLLYCVIYTYLGLGVPLMRAFHLMSPISMSEICWALCVVIYVVELVRAWPTEAPEPYALCGPVPRLVSRPPQDWIPRSRVASRPSRSQGMFGGGWQSPHRQVRFGRTGLR